MSCFSSYKPHIKIPSSLYTLFPTSSTNLRFGIVFSFISGVMFSDILFDLAAVIPESVGLLPSASLGDSGPGIFEPVHGSAPKHYGNVDTANPLASVLSAVMILRYGLKEEKAAKKLEEAVFDVLDRGFRTRDIHTTGTIQVGCKRMGQEIMSSLNAKVLVSNGSFN